METMGKRHECPVFQDAPERSFAMKNVAAVRVAAWRENQAPIFARLGLSQRRYLCNHFQLDSPPARD